MKVKPWHCRLLGMAQESGLAAWLAADPAAIKHMITSRVAGALTERDWAELEPGAVGKRVLLREVWAPL